MSAKVRESLIRSSQESGNVIADEFQDSRAGSGSFFEEGQNPRKQVTVGAKQVWPRVTA